MLPPPALCVMFLVEPTLLSALHSSRLLIICQLNKLIIFLLLPVLYPLVSAARLVGVVVKRADPRLSVPLELPIFNLRKDQSNIYGVCCTAT